MTRKHFQLIADAVKLNGGDQWLALARDFANRLQSENPRFDRQRFINACEPR